MRDYDRRQEEFDKEFDKTWKRAKSMSIFGGVVAFILVAMVMWILILGIIWLTRTVL